jgi:mannose-6-phosphate isomerase
MVGASDHLYPLTFSPVLKPYVWGARNLERLYGRVLPAGKIAESWEIAAHPAGMSIVDNGPLAGYSLQQLQEQMGLALLGSSAAQSVRTGRFPLLVKLLDAQRRLSVQVHPDDAFARSHENEEYGKSEMWVVLHAEPDAAIILGVREGTTKSAFRQAIATGKLEQYLHRLALRSGDFVCVPSGSLHAILGGLVIAEIQQSSDVTYRVYDWSRNDPERPLHVDRALQVINFEQIEPGLPAAEPLATDLNYRHELLCRNSHFTVERLYLQAGGRFTGRCDGRSLELWGTASGLAVLEWTGGSTELEASRFALMPAAMGDYAVLAREAATMLRVYAEES